MYRSITVTVTIEVAQHQALLRVSTFMVIYQLLTGHTNSDEFTSKNTINEKDAMGTPMDGINMVFVLGAAISLFDKNQ